MLTWLVAHNQDIGQLLLGGLGGVIFAAWRQLKLERPPANPSPYDWATDRGGTA